MHYRVLMAVVGVGTIMTAGCMTEVRDETAESFIDADMSTVQQAEDGEAQPEDPSVWRVFCPEGEHGPICSRRCFDARIGCVYAAVHPYRGSSVNPGLLYQCTKLLVGYMCSYDFDSGDMCDIPFSVPFPAECTPKVGAE